MEGLLKNKRLFEEDAILTPDLALYEVANSIWKHQYLLKDLKDGREYLAVFNDLVDSGAIRLLRPGIEIMSKAYHLASKHRITVYDAVFLSLALESGMDLRSRDGEQNAIFRKEMSRKE